MNLDEITLETAQPLVNTVFQVTVDENTTLELKLIDVAPFDLPRRPPRGSKPPKRAPFALYFLGPHEPIVPQRMYDFRSEATTFEGLFIVPVGRDDEGTEYEAVFS
jgi:hypothetical protein